MVIQIKTRGVEDVQDGAGVTHVSNLTTSRPSMRRASCLPDVFQDIVLKGLYRGLQCLARCLLVVG
ncbi:hypothetical protein [Halomonas sp. CKK8]|uniref:hypothetical protein n=1 Tax=Halomonas sp. CKK8 TaxID=3036127 RepID=UPI00241551AD|nr:hypothetical protein [Halomonas sp. CKK8]WFM70521.1 hypothetical protein P8934_14055 [Halomonas sp. CKK8]